VLAGFRREKEKSGWAELNRRPPAPQAGTLNQLRYSPISAWNLPSRYIGVKTDAAGSIAPASDAEAGLKKKRLPGPGSLLR
jgi:hypothetical protein